MKFFFTLSIAFAIAAFGIADLKKIEGTWKVLEGKIGANALPKALTDKMVLIIKNGKYDYDEGHGHDTGNLKDIKGDPMGMDIVGTEGPNKGKTYLTIYKMDGKNLVICYGLDGKRPTSFDGKGKVMLVKYQKSK